MKKYIKKKNPKWTYEQDIGETRLRRRVAPLLMHHNEQLDWDQGGWWITKHIYKIIIQNDKNNNNNNSKVYMTPLLRKTKNEVVDDMKDRKSQIGSQMYTYKHTIIAPCESQQPGTPPNWVTCAGDRLAVLSEHWRKRARIWALLIFSLHQGEHRIHWLQDLLNLQVSGCWLSISCGECDNKRKTRKSHRGHRVKIPSKVSSNKTWSEGDRWKQWKEKKKRIRRLCRTLCT